MDCNNTVNYVEMMKRNSWDERETFEAYGKRSSVASMLYLREDRKIEVINLQTGEEKLVKRDVEAVIRSNEDHLRTFCQESGDESCLSGSNHTNGA